MKCQKIQERSTNGYDGAQSSEENDMVFFNRNPNETAYVGGKKHWADVIKSPIDVPDLLIWRQPEEDFNTNSTLIVGPGEEAIFIKGGTIAQIFDNGTYRLSTENYPFISLLRNAMSGGISTFNCVVYFVRTAHSMEIGWGTESPIIVRDKRLNIATPVRARGSYKVTVKDPGIFLTKLLGSNMPFVSQDGLTRYFANEFQSEIKTIITRELNDTEDELLGLEARLKEFSGAIEPHVQEILANYGLKCVQFVVSALDIDINDELRRNYDERLMGMGLDNMEKVRGAEADREVMTILGDAWGRQRAVDTLHDLANNPNAGGIASVGAGAGMGMAAGGAIGFMAEQAFSPIRSAPPAQPLQQGRSSRFVQEGSQAAESQVPEAPVKSTRDLLVELMKYFKEGLISQSEYDAKKAEILKRM